MICPICESEFTPDGNRHKYCNPNCSRLAQIENVRRYQAKKKPNGCIESTIVILDDPDPYGGFPKGATISTLELQCCLGIGAFTPGTIILERSQTYRIEGKDGYEQRKVLA